MKFLEKHPMIMIVIGIIGISLSAIFVKYSEAPHQELPESSEGFLQCRLQIPSV